MSNPIVTIEMENGKKIVAELYPDIAPQSVRNFISLANAGFYNGLIFHRCIFIIFRKQNKVIVSVLTCICLFIETGARSHINFTANNWFNIISQCSSVKINRPIHNSMVCYGKAIHTKLFCSFCYFFYFT